MFMYVYGCISYLYTTVDLYIWLLLIKEIYTHASIVLDHIKIWSLSINQYLLLPWECKTRASIRSLKYKTHSIVTNYKNSSQHGAKSRTNHHYVDSIYEASASWSPSTANLHTPLNSWHWIATMLCSIWPWVISRGRRGSSWRRRSSTRPHCLYWRMCRIMCCISFSSGRDIRIVNWPCIAWRLSQPIGASGYG